VQLGGTVRWRLTLWYIAVLALTFAVFGLVMEGIEARGLQSEVDRQLLGILHSTTAALDRAYREDPNINPSHLAREVAEMSLPADTGLSLELPNGQTLSWNTQGIPDTLLHAWLRSPTKADIAWTGQSGDQRWRVVRFQRDAGPGFVGRVVLARDLSFMDAQLRSFGRTLALVLPSVLVLAAVGGYWLASRALRPVARITARARHIEAHGLDQRLDVERPDDEFGRLAYVLNDLFERLERAFQQQRRFLADAAHELRTPVAVVRSQTDVALQRARPVDEYVLALNAIRTETEHLSAIVDDLLLMARADAAQLPVQKDLVDLVEIVDECCRSLRPLAQERNLTLRWNVGLEQSVCADGRLLRRAVANLLSNAISYTPGGGTISVDVRREPERAVLEVADTGIGIASEDLPHVFDRFYRARQQGGIGTEGSGLGLGIVKMIADLHGGSVTVESRLGAGSTFSLAIPLE
jgi:heavy metal sensor kinase